MKHFGRPEQFLKVWKKIRNVREKNSKKMYGKKSRGSKILATRGRGDFVKFYLAPPQNACCPSNAPPQIPRPGAATASNGNDTKHYIGMTSSTFKERYRNHIKSFAHKKYSNETELSKHIWHLKQNKTDFTIKWSIIKKSISYTGGSKRCNLCLEEKLELHFES